jgi:hypothetical protein
MLLNAVITKACDRESAPAVVIVSISPEANHHQCRGLLMFSLSVSACSPSARKNSHRTRLPKLLTLAFVQFAAKDEVGNNIGVSFLSVIAITWLAFLGSVRHRYFPAFYGGSLC